MQDKPMKAEKMPRMLPSIRVDERDLPAIREWKVGQTYIVQAKIKQMSSSLGDGMDGMMVGDGTKKNKIMSARFEIIEIKSIGEDKKETKIAPKEVSEYLTKKVKEV